MRIFCVWLVKVVKKEEIESGLEMLLVYYNVDCLNIILYTSFLSF